MGIDPLLLFDSIYYSAAIGALAIGQHFLRASIDNIRYLQTRTPNISDVSAPFLREYECVQRYCYLMLTCVKNHDIMFHINFSGHLESIQTHLTDLRSPIGAWRGMDTPFSTWSRFWSSPWIHQDVHIPNVMVVGLPIRNMEVFPFRHDGLSPLKNIIHCHKERWQIFPFTKTWLVVWNIFYFPIYWE